MQRHEWHRIFKEHLKIKLFNYLKFIHNHDTSFDNLFNDIR